jgi:phage-related minor tail protein
MNEPRIKKPTSKTFHFPKGAKAEKAPEDTKAAAPGAEAVSANGSAEPKASRKAATKSTAKAKAAPKAAAKEKATEKAAPKAKAAAKPQAATKKKAAAKKPAAPKKAAPAKKEAAPVSEATTQKPKRAKKEVEKKEKVVRDSFTMPKSDYAKIATLKQKCLNAGVSVKKSEVLRAGLLLLEGATLENLLAAISAVETVKTGRPSKE